MKQSEINRLQHLQDKLNCEAEKLRDEIVWLGKGTLGCFWTRSIYGNLEKCEFIELYIDYLHFGIDGVHQFDFPVSHLANKEWLKEMDYDFILERKQLEENHLEKQRKIAKQLDLERIKETLQKYGLKAVPA